MAQPTKKTSADEQPVRGARMSRAAENYLLSLAILQEDGVSPHISQLASYLRNIPPEEEVGTTLASVSGMIQRMAKDGLLQVSKDKEIVLTTEGERRARTVVRRHRLSERLLVDVLDVPLERLPSPDPSPPRVRGPWAILASRFALGWCNSGVSSRS